MLKKILISPWTALLTLALVLGIRAADPGFVESVRLRYFDTLITSQPAVQNNIHVVDIDDATLEKYGQWPLPRDQYARVIQDLYNRNAGLVVFNVLMPNPDRSGKDAVLSSTLKQYPVVLPSVPGDRTQNQPRVPGSAVIGAEWSDSIVQYPGMIANISVLENAAAGVGIVGTMPEIDGVNRRVPLVVAVDGKIYPALSLEVLRVAAGDTTVQVKLSELGVEKMRIPKFGPVSTDSLGRVWVDWSQRSQQHSLTELPKDFGGGIVIVGATAAGIGNPVPTAVGAVFPHQLQAAVLATMTNGVVIQRPAYADSVEIMSVLLAGLLLLFLTRWTYVGLASVVVLVGGGVAVSILAYSNFLFLFDATAFAVGTTLVALHAYGVKFVSEFLQKQAIKKQFAGYASPTVVRLLQENPDLIKKGTKREVSICFSDLRGFTPLGESFGDDVGGLTKVMNGYMDAITQPILQANGMVIKYIGDASMHIHNAPIDDPDHAKTAVAVGLQMVRAVKEFSKQLEAAGRPGVKMGAGINTGLGYIGEMGSTQRHSYDVLGDAVSTTARIESKCKEYGCVLLVGEETVRRCGDDFFFLKIDDLAVKGKSVGVGICTVLDDVTEEYHQAKLTHNKMHELYRLQKFDAAIILCQELMNEFDGKMAGYYEMWIERCEFQKTQTLPPDWNGVFIATSK
jgi:adenylate cyclase